MRCVRKNCRASILSHAIVLALCAVVSMGVGCAKTPTTLGMICIRDAETGEPVQGATVVIAEMVMFKSGQAGDGGFTGVDGCVTLKAGLLDRMALFIDTPDGAHYSGALSHPRVSSSLTRITLPSTYTPGAPTLEVVLTEVK
jgi:hypothetical protein